MATAASVKKKIQGLIDAAGNCTGEVFADLTTAVAALIAGFGHGGDGDTLLEDLNEIYSWKKYTSEMVTETEVSNQAISYYNPVSTSDLSNFQWDTVSYADSIEIIDGEIVLVDPLRFTMNKESTYSVVIGKYIQTSYDDCFYRIPEDAKMSYSKVSNSTSEYIRATKAMRLAVEAEAMLGYVVSDNRNSYPDDGELDGYYYEYNGVVGTDGLDTSDADATEGDLLDGKTAYVGGEKITGTLAKADELLAEDAEVGFYFLTGSNGESGSGVTMEAAVGEGSGRAVVDADTVLILRAPTSEFGTAVAADVAEGKTFTSVAGLLIEGTHKCTGGIDTSDATAGPEDILTGKTAYAGGQKVTGTMAEKGAVTVDGAAVGFYFLTGSNGESGASVTMEASVGEENGRGVVNADTLLTLRAPVSEFGTATQADVAAGKTFTSAAGFLMKGTHECDTSAVTICDALEVEAMSALHVWQKKTLSSYQIAETEASNVILSYYGVSSGHAWNDVPYADEVTISNGQISLVNPTTISALKDSASGQVLLGKYVYAEYTDSYYRIPADASIAYSQNSYGTAEYIRASIAYKLSVDAGDGEFQSYMVSADSDAFPQDGEQDGYWYLYEGTMDDHYA